MNICLFFYGMGEFFFLLRHLQDGDSKYPWLSYGIIFGFAAMTRTYAITMPIVIALSYLSNKYSLKKAAQIAILSFCVMQIVNLPWIIRNYREWKVPVIYAVASHSIYNFTNPMSKPELGHFPKIGEGGYSEDYARASASGNPGRLQRAANHEIKEWFLEDPLAFSSLSVSKLLYFMHWGKQKGVWPLWYQFTEGNFDAARKPSPWVRKQLEDVSYVFYYVIFHGSLIALILMFFARRKSIYFYPGAVAFVGCLLIWCGMHFIIMPDPKYRFPIEPIMITLTAFLLCRVNAQRSALFKRESF